MTAVKRVIVERRPSVSSVPGRQNQFPIPRHASRQPASQTVAANKKTRPRSTQWGAGCTADGSPNRIILPKTTRFSLPPTARPPMKLSDLWPRWVGYAENFDRPCRRRADRDLRGLSRAGRAGGVPPDLRPAADHPAGRATAAPAAGPPRPPRQHLRHATAWCWPAPSRRRRCFVDPKFMQEVYTQDRHGLPEMDEAVAKLARVLGKEPEEVSQLLADRSRSRFVKVAENLDDATCDKVRQAQPPRRRHRAVRRPLLPDGLSGRPRPRRRRLAGARARRAGNEVRPAS